jgi:hypothetical protein
MVILFRESCTSCFVWLCLLSRYLQSFVVINSYTNWCRNFSIHLVYVLTMLLFQFAMLDYQKENPTKNPDNVPFISQQIPLIAH